VRVAVHTHRATTATERFCGDHFSVLKLVPASGRLGWFALPRGFGAVPALVGHVAIVLGLAALDIGLTGVVPGLTAVAHGSRDVRSGRTSEPGDDKMTATMLIRRILASGAALLVLAACAPTEAQVVDPDQVGQAVPDPPAGAEEEPDGAAAETDDVSPPWSRLPDADRPAAVSRQPGGSAAETDDVSPPWSRLPDADRPAAVSRQPDGCVTVNAMLPC
jgi:hypothetical protein